MEKMSAVKPSAKQPRLQNQTQVTRNTNVAPRGHDVTPQPGNVPPTTSPSTETKTDSRPTHPKGHRVRELSEVWKTMDSQDFLHLTDTYVLGDVWVQPSYVQPSTGAYTTVTWLQIVLGPHIKHRYASSKIAVDDLLKMLYLNDCLQADSKAPPKAALDYDAWLADKTAAMIKCQGVDDAQNRAKLAAFVINEDTTFAFSPATPGGLSSVFFRKICVHSYKSTDGEDKLINPSMMKCCATRGKLEFMLEARIIPLPADWWTKVKPYSGEESTEDVPESQPLDL